jgi:hypothetical protein
MTNTITPILTRKQFDDTVSEMAKPYVRSIEMFKTPVKDMLDVMWNLIDTYRVELLGVRDDGGFVWGFNQTPVGVVTYDSYTGKEDGEYTNKVRLMVTSPHIQKQRGNKNAIVSSSVKGMAARLNAGVIKPATINGILPMVELIKAIDSIGTHSSKPNYPSLSESYESLLSCLDPVNNTFSGEPAPEIISWAKECREAKVKAEEKFKESTAVRESFRHGVLIFIQSHSAITHKKLLMIRTGATLQNPNAPIPVDSEWVQVRWIDSFDEIENEYPHVAGINNLMRMSSLDDIKCGLIAPADVSLFTHRFHYSPVYGYIRGRRELRYGLGMHTFAVVPATPISNDTKGEEVKVDTATRQMSALFGE